MLVLLGFAGLGTATSAQLCQDSIRPIEALVIEDLGKTYTAHPTMVPPYLMATKSDLGGTTSVRRIDGPNLKWKTQGYYQRNRELGQCFNIPLDTSFQLRAIVLRTGNSSNAVLSGAPGAEMYLQLFEVVGDPVINDNGTPPGTESTHGFNTNHRTDDYLEGVSYQTLGIYTGGVFPNFEPTSQNGGQPGHLRYMRWDLKAAKVTLQGGKRYAFMVGFATNGPGKGFSLGNNNQAASSADPLLRRDDHGLAWWSMRREGDGTLPPTQLPSDLPPENDSLRQALISESLYEDNHSCTLSPTTDGFPDVDTYRALEFYIEVENGCPTAGTPCDDGDSTTVNDVADGYCGCFGEVIGGCESNGLLKYERYDDEFTSTPTINALKTNRKFPDQPDEVRELTFFEAPTNHGRRFGARMSGYICAPLTGSYTFFIAGDDHVELNLGTDNTPDDLRRIAHHDGITLPRQWDKYGTQQSRPIQLQAGTFYYIEALMKQDEGNDHLAVAWRLPNGIFQGPISGQHLSSEISCPPVGTPCDDGLANTENDQEDGHCRCQGENTCPAMGTSCNDQNHFTELDQEDGHCLCQGTLVTSTGLTVTAIGKTYDRDVSVTPDYLFFDQADQGGSTSVRNVDADNLSWKTAGYFQRNRDLGQTFSIPPDTSFTLDAIVLRTGNSASAVKLGAIGAEVYLQLFEVEGDPTINDNGTPVGTSATHGFTTNHRADDFLEGISYKNILVASGGFFPAIGPTNQNGGQVGHLHYLRWDLIGENEIKMEGGKRYAFIVGFMEPAPERRFTLGNENLAAHPTAPELRTDILGQPRWSMRREGDGTLPPTQLPGENPPSDPAIQDSLIQESLFEFGHQYTLPPATEGWPDVDTYRTLEFYVETKADVINSVQEHTGFRRFEIFPNPSQGRFMVAFDYEGASNLLKIEVHDFIGRKIFTEWMPTQRGMNRKYLSLSQKGVYMISIADEHCRITKKITLL